MLQYIFFHLGEKAEHVKTEIKQEALLEVCRMACRGQVKRVPPPGEGGEETQDWEEM